VLALPGSITTATIAIAKSEIVVPRIETVSPIHRRRKFRSRNTERGLASRRRAAPVSDALGTGHVVGLRVGASSLPLMRFEARCLGRPVATWTGDPVRSAGEG
jgi:hypothetical protein